jgi:hypothetical protein
MPCYFFSQAICDITYEFLITCFVHFPINNFIKMFQHGGFLIHVVVAMFTFLGLAIVCDEYFVASLDRICEELKLSPDVAGATFMAAGKLFKISQKKMC